MGNESTSHAVAGINQKRTDIVGEIGVISPDIAFGAQDTRPL
jgi:hypothetical protein